MHVPMKSTSFLRRAYDLYADGFRNMTLGRELWAVILIKLFIIFAVLKVFFFPDYLKQNAPDVDKAGYVSTQLVERSAK